LLISLPNVYFFPGNSYFSEQAIPTFAVASSVGKLDSEFQAAVERFPTSMTDPVSLLLQKYKIINYRDLFGKKQYSKANMPKELDYLIKPFLLTEEQRGCRAGILLLLC
jgi:uncharacterized protein YqgQ